MKPYVLRYWEQEFTQLKPMKRRGNRRYYQHDDVQMIRRIRSLLYEQGFTIGGARQRLRELPKAASTARPPTMQPTAPVPMLKGKFTRAELKQMRSELEAALKLLDR